MWWKTLLSTIASMIGKNNPDAGQKTNTASGIANLIKTKE